MLMLEVSWLISVISVSFPDLGSRRVFFSDLVFRVVLMPQQQLTVAMATGYPDW